MFSRMAPMSIPGVILSQLLMHTRASTLCAPAMYSTLSAIISREGSEYSIPSWPIAMPSSMAIVLNSAAKHPCFSISDLTYWPTPCRCTCPGTICVNELAMPITGRPKCSSFIPFALQRLRAPAMRRPWVVCELLSGCFISSCVCYRFFVNP